MFAKQTRSALREWRQCRHSLNAPQAGFEPAHPAPEADALSPELLGLRAGSVLLLVGSPVGGTCARRALD